MPQTVLTAEHRRIIDKGLADLKEAEDIIRRAELAGLDMSAERARHDAVRKQLQGLRSAFFPTGG
jgi:predicted DNA-binding protein (UPF0278 family)